MESGSFPGGRGGRQFAARARAAPFPGDARALRSVWDAHSLLFISQSNFEKNCVSPACRAVSVHSVRARLPSPPDAHLSVCPLQGGDEASYTLVRGASDALSDPELSAHQAVDGTHERRRTGGPAGGRAGAQAAPHQARARAPGSPGNPVSFPPSVLFPCNFIHGHQRSTPHGGSPQRVPVRSCWFLDSG